MAWTWASAFAWAATKHLFFNDTVYEAVLQYEPAAQAIVDTVVATIVGALPQRAQPHRGPVSCSSGVLHTPGAHGDVGLRPPTADAWPAGTWTLLSSGLLLAVAAALAFAFLAGAAGGAAATYCCLRRRDRLTASRAQRLDAVASYVRQGGAEATLAVAADLGVAPHQVATWAASWERALQGPGGGR